MFKQNPLRAFHGGVAAFFFMTASAIALSSHVSPQDFRIEIPATLTHGSLPTNRGLRVSVYLPEQAIRKGDPTFLDDGVKELDLLKDSAKHRAQGY